MAKKKSTARSGSGSGDSNIGDSDFETALSEVETIVAKLEAGDLGLTESLHQYEIGIGRLKQCHRLLEAAEQRVCVLSGFDANGNPVTEAIDDLEVRTGGGRGAASKKSSKSPTQGADHALGQDLLDSDGGEDGPIGLF